MPPESPSLAGRKKWLVPRYPELPGTIMRLGLILTDPKNLDSCLNLDAIPPIPDSRKRDAAMPLKLRIEAELLRESSLLGSVAAPSEPILGGLVSASASVNGGWSLDPRTTVEALNLRAEIFNPTKEYMNEALKSGGVVDAVRQSLFQTTLYVIVGVATASKLSITEKQSGKSNLGASAKASAGEGVNFAIEGSRKREAGSNIKWEIGQECDFAYRVRQFAYAKFFGLRDKGDHTDGALFGSEDAPPSDSVDERSALPQFDWLDDEDASVSGVAVLEEE
ncbi:hypothetical protein BJY01DRAFT_252232 [Aspergillus pseudoustus]|uniref:Uncharacterized protein n=1 Tax=Aspergillus pseudoustus TaxID=1810923 RepID=A0ABR4J7G1_9EURO